MFNMTPEKFSEIAENLDPDKPLQVSQAEWKVITFSILKSNLFNYWIRYFSKFKEFQKVFVY